MREYIDDHLDIVAIGAILTFFVSLVLCLSISVVANTRTQYECLSYGYPQYRMDTMGNPAYCVRRIFDTDEVRTLEELRRKAP